MYNDGSTEFNALINKSGGNAPIARFTFPDFTIERFIKLEYCGGSNNSDDIVIGTTNMAYLNVSAVTDKVITNQEFLFEVGMELSDGTVEYAPMGYFTVQKPDGDEDTISFTAYDRMQKFEKPFVSGLSYPTDSAKILNELCTICGVELATPITNPIAISENLQGYTCREVLGYIAGIHGFFACFDRYGKLNLRWYSDIPIVKQISLIWALTKSQNDYVVEKVTLAKDAETIYTSGTGTRGINHSNPYATQNIADSIYSHLGGFTYRPCVISMIDDIRLDPWDVLKVTYLDGNVLTIPVMSLSHSFTGCETRVVSVGKSDIENEYSYSGPVTQAMERMTAELLVANKIIATKVDADWVNAHAVTTDKLEATNARVSTLEANSLTAEQADLKYATISSLNAQTARVDDLKATALTADSAVITDLDAGIADINTLIFGSATGTTIQTEFSNAVIAQLGDAQIKSAMIANIDAGKINSGTIYTNKVHIYGDESNKLSIVDNTIAISDGTHTRVQIGKDASNDYNMYVWDRNGKLMFDALGLTADGVTRKVIRDDVVQDNANISASKLNIDSLFNVINTDGSHTLKSSKIYLDEQAQTLDVAFKSMATTVDGLQTTQSSQGTQISIIQGQITSKVWQQDITTAVNDLEIGGRNLFLGTGAEHTNNEHLLAEYKPASEPLIAGEVYTVTICVTPAKNVEYISPYFSAGGKRATNLYVNGTSKQTVSRTFIMSYSQGYDPSVNPDFANVRFYRFPKDGVTGNTTIHWIKIEKGNKATDWSPAPEDTQKQITTISTQYATIDQTVNSLSSTVARHTAQISTKADSTTVTGVQRQVSSLQQDLTGFKTTVSNTYTTKTEFNGLEIGGRNLVIDSDTEYSNAEYCIAKYFITPNEGGELDKGYGYLISGEIYTISICFTPAAQNIQLAPYLSLGGKQQCLLYANGTTNKQIASATFQAAYKNGHSPEERPLNARVDIYRFPKDGVTGNTTIHWIKIEKGNKATDWSPAPEDIDTRVSTAESTISQQSEMISTKVSKDGVISAINQSAEAVTIQANKINLSGYLTVSAANDNYTTKTEFNALEIGGRNLLYDTKAMTVGTGGGNIAKFYKIWRDDNGTGGSLKQTEDGLKLTFGANYNTSIQAPLANSGSIENNEKVTLSFTYRGNITSFGQWYFIQDTGNNIVVYNFPDLVGDEEWHHYEHTFSSPKANVRTCVSVLMFFGLPSYDSTKWIEIKESTLKLEKGNKPTDWTPAPEDISVENIYKENTTLIDGGKIYTGSITANAIAASSITGDKLNMEEIFSRNITATNLNITGGKIDVKSNRGITIYTELTIDLDGMHSGIEFGNADINTKVDTNGFTLTAINPKNNKDFFYWMLNESGLNVNDGTQTHNVFRIYNSGKLYVPKLAASECAVEGLLAQSIETKSVNTNSVYASNYYHVYGTGINAVIHNVTNYVTYQEYLVDTIAGFTFSDITWTCPGGYELVHATPVIVDSTDWNKQVTLFAQSVGNTGCRLIYCANGIATIRVRMNLTFRSTETI